MKSYRLFSAILLLSCSIRTALCFGLAPESSWRSQDTASQISAMSRRNLLIQSTAVIAAGTLGAPLRSHAAKPPSEPLTKENVEAAFDALRFEREDAKGGIAIMQQLLDDGDFTGLLEFTKTYDQILRKLKWGRAKSFLTNNAEKEVATMQGNAITFDLIGMNRSSRPGQENAQAAQKYLNELKTDLEKVIEMESKIQYDGFDVYMNSIKGGQ